VEKKFWLAPVAQEIVDGLRRALAHSFIELHDNQKKNNHVWLFREWRTKRSERLHVPQGRCHVEATVNDRWTLAVWTWSVRPLHPDAHSLVRWAAQKLAAHLPRTFVSDLPYAPTGGGGGPLGPAEMGIPVWWARRTRN
jgi:hypothetical protein